MKQLLGHTSPETAYVIADYPYGFRLRTSIRYWIESKKGFGDRFVSQTMNPKTGNWNKPKAGNYRFLMVMYLDEKNYVQTAAIHASYLYSAEVVTSFQACWQLTTGQRYALDRAHAYAVKVHAYAVKVNEAYKKAHSIEA